MPNGRPYESPLNKLADALPNFILSLQDMKMRQETQEALSSYRTMMLTERINAREAEEETRRALEQVREKMGYYEPPEVKVLRDNISYEMKTLNDPDIGLTLGDEDITKRWKKLNNMEADYFGKTGRHISVSMPVSVEGALARIEKEKPSPVAAPPAKAVKPPEKLKPKIFETAEEYQRRLAGEEVSGIKLLDYIPRLLETKAEYWKRIEALRQGKSPAPTQEPAVEEVPPEFPDPSGLPENQTATFNGEPWIIRNGQWMKVK